LKKLPCYFNFVMHTMVKFPQRNEAGDCLNIIFFQENETAVVGHEVKSNKKSSWRGCNFYMKVDDRLLLTSKFQVTHDIEICNKSIGNIMVVTFMWDFDGSRTKNGSTEI